MKKIVLLAAVLGFYSLNVFADTYNFSILNPNSSSNEILFEYMEQNIQEFDSEIISFFYDINGDGIQEILGIVKSNKFYNSNGYKLIALKKEENSWQELNSNIYFDITKDIDINKNKVTYYKTSLNLNKNKKYKSKISIKKSGGFSLFNFFKRLKNSNKTLEVSEGKSGVEFNASELEVPVQRAVKIKYNDLSDRTKHYLEMK